MKSWSQRELALAVLVVLAAIFVPYAAVPLLARPWNSSSPAVRRR